MKLGQNADTRLIDEYNAERGNLYCDDISVTPSSSLASS